jgi:uncharacterized phage protein gp47/JayE
MASYLPTFDELYAAILADYQNEDGTVDAEARIRCAVMAAAIWGAYQHQGIVERNVFPDSCDYESLVHHGTVAGLAPEDGETEDEFRARLKANEQQPPAGGNENDYKTWAEEVEAVALATVFPLAQGDGTVDIVPLADGEATGSEVPSNSSRIGITTSAATNKLLDSGAAFLTGLTLEPGDVVENPAKRRSSAVVSVDGAGELTLADDIFQYANEAYIIYHHTGTVTTVTANKLVDSAGVFDDSGYPAQKGDVVENLDEGTTTTIETVTAAGELDLAGDIFTTLGERYVVRGTLAQVKKNIDENRPVGASRCAVVAPTLQTQSVTMGVSGDTVDRPHLRLDIEAYQNALVPGQTLRRSQLIALAIQNGADDVSVTVPAADVVPAGYATLRPNVTTVT